MLTITTQIIKLVDYLKWLYMQYLLNTALYMLEPFEVRIFNVIVITVLLTWTYSTYLFLPNQISTFIQSLPNISI